MQNTFVDLAYGIGLAAGFLTLRTPYSVTMVRQSISRDVQLPLTHD